MSLETEVAALTEATTDLLEAVNVRKAALDAAEAEATAQAVIATTQAGIASTKADASAASANAAASAVVSQLASYLTQTQTARDQALDGLGAADNSQILSVLTGSIAYVIDLALKTVDGVAENRGTVASTDRAELYALMFAELFEKVGVIGRAISGGTVELQAGTAAIPSLMADTDVDTGLFWPAANSLGIATGGVERLRVTAEGRVGVGTNAPSGLLDVNDNKLRVRTAQTPASAGAAGNAGEVCWDSSFLYVCVATNVWKRAALSTW